MISGIWLPLVTPFKDGKVDIAALQRLTRHYLKSRPCAISGIVALGTTAEAQLLSMSERDAVLETVFDVTNGRLPVMIGVGGMDTHAMQVEMAALSHWNPAAFLVSAPAYIRPDQAGIQWHFEQIARSTSRSIVLYDVPHRTGVAIEPKTVARLLACDNVVAIKACVPETFAPLSRLPIDLLCGTDDAFMACLAAGGTGGILASAHLFAEHFTAIQRLFHLGEEARAFSRFNALRPLIDLLFSAPNPAAIKACLALDGLIEKTTRLPIMTASASLTFKLELALSVFAHGVHHDAA
jgi:4-hydroxy-tetrahydrodipicolinate synthase